MARPSNVSAKPQYHHFIPQFLLQNFSHPYEHPASRSNDFHGAFGWRKGGWVPKETSCPGQSVLNVIDLHAGYESIFSKPICKKVAITDMYRDRRERGKHGQHIEKKLSALEAKAAAVITKILVAFDNSKDAVTITRTERDLLRKFIFIMKYGSSTIHQGFYHDSSHNYAEADRKQLAEYMKKKRFERPLDVWLDNIKAMLEVEMDPEETWLSRLMEHAYPEDAMWFFRNCQAMYLTLCTPSKSEEEFILTENAYSLHEGPGGFFRNAMTKETTISSYAEFHIFAPVSPRLMIVLRSSLLPTPKEYVTDQMKQKRSELREQLKAQHGWTHPDLSSILEDLPVRKAENSYSQFVDGRQVLHDGASESRSARDQFHFRIFPVSTEHTDRINFIMLENAATFSTIVFNSHSAMRRTIREYLCTPSEVNGVPSFKVFEGPQDKPRLVFLKRLERLLEWMDGMQEEWT